MLGYDKDDYFWLGIQPMSLQDSLEDELQSKNLWTDLTLPPSMNRVIETATKVLNQAMYQLRDVSSHSRST